MGVPAPDILLVQTECVLTHVVRARADIEATKLGIILSSFLSHTSKSEGGQRTRAKQMDTALRFWFFGWLWQGECMRYG